MNKSIIMIMIKKAALLAAAWSVVLLPSAVTAQDAGTFTDPRDGKTYRTVKTGKQVWFAQNLDYAAKGSKCYENRPAFCARYGKLYDWKTAAAACPAGWHLPSDAEWSALVDYAGGMSAAATKLKAPAGWENESDMPAAKDDYGFSALPGGNGHSGGNFYDAGDHGYWWSASERNATGAYYRNLYVGYDYEYVYRHYGDKGFLFSVRCMQD